MFHGFWAVDTLNERLGALVLSFAGGVTAFVGGDGEGNDGDGTDGSKFAGRLMVTASLAVEALGVWVDNEQFLKTA